MPELFYTSTWRVLYGHGIINCCTQVRFWLQSTLIFKKTTNLDTDSVIFLAPRNQRPPFEEGSMLGQMKNEYPDHDIQAFYSGGFVLVSIKGSMKKIFSCKQYGLQLCNRKTGEISHVLKCRGLTLDSTNNDKFNFSKFKEMINNYGLVPREAVCLDRDRFRPNWHKGIVLTKNCPISYSPIFDKGIFSTADAEIIFNLQGLVDELYDVYPYGYIGTAVKDPLRKFKPQFEYFFGINTFCCNLYSHICCYHRTHT